MRAMRFLLVLLVPFILLDAQAGPATVDLTLLPNDDTFVRDKPGERDVNLDGHGCQILITAEGFPTGVPVDVGYLRFDLSNLSGEVTSARLRVYNRVSPGSRVTVAAYGTVGDDWNGVTAGLGDEATLTWNNAPAEDRWLGEQAGASRPAWIEFDGPELAAYVNEQRAGDGLVTFRVQVTSTGLADICILEDRENGGGTGNLPELVVEVSAGRKTLYLPLITRWRVR
jgi:hypothetical protein